MSEMTERVAKAIASTYERDDVTGALEPWEHHMESSRAAIETIELTHFIVPHNDMRRLIHELVDASRQVTEPAE